MRLLALVLALATPITASAQSQSWGGVGRLDIGDRRLCTGSLIEPDLVLTAAHCLLGDDGEEVDPFRITFRAGLDGAREEATRRGRASGRGPGGVGPVGASALDLVPGDLAVLRLDRPVTSFRAIPLEIGPAPFADAPLRLVSYAAGRTDAAEVQDGCQLIERAGGILVTDCVADLGASGSPVIDDQGRIVGVLSASALREGVEVALAADIQGALLGRLRMEAQTTRTAQALGGATRRFGPGSGSGDGSTDIGDEDGARGSARFVQPSAGFVRP